MYCFSYSTTNADIAEIIFTPGSVKFQILLNHNVTSDKVELYFILLGTCSSQVFLVFSEVHLVLHSHTYRHKKIKKVLMEMMRIKFSRTRRVYQQKVGIYQDSEAGA